MIQLRYSVDFTSYGVCKSVGVGSTQTSIFSPNAVFHSLYYSQEALRHVCFLQFSSISEERIWNFRPKGDGRSGS